MSEALQTSEQWQAEIERRIGELREARVQQLGEKSLLWLALVPVWTERLAESCDFPLENFNTLESFLDAAERANQVRRQAATGFELDIDYLSVRGVLKVLPFCSPRLREQLTGQTLKRLGRLDGAVQADLLASDGRSLGEALPAAIETATERIAAGNDPVFRAGSYLRLSRATRDTAMIETLRGRAADSAEHITDPRQRALLAGQLLPNDKSDIPPVLLEAVEDKWLRPLLAPAADSIYAHYGQRYLAWLQTDVGDADPSVRLGAITALGNLGSIGLPTLLNTATSGSDDTKWLAVHSIGSVGLGVSVPALIGLLTSRNARQRLEVTRALGKIGAQLTEESADTIAPACDALIEALQDDQAQVRVKAAEALSDIPNDESGEIEHALREAIGHNDNATSLAAAMALLRLVPPVHDVGAAVERVENADDALLRVQGLTLLLKRGVPASSTRRTTRSKGQPFSDDLARQVLDLIGKIGSERDKSKALRALPPLERRHAEVALAMANSIMDPELRVETLAALVKGLPEEMVDPTARSIALLRIERQFWMPDGQRADTLELLSPAEQESRGARRAELRGEARLIGRNIKQAATEGQPVNAELLRWAQLAARSPSGEDRASSWLSKEISKQLEQGNLSEAMTWLRAGRTLARALHGELDATVLLGSRLLEMEYRREQDRRHLRKFLERKEQTDALEELLGDPGEHWALHYLGVGGVGKTMLIRHVTAQLAPQRGLPTARVDFDYLSPDYPVRRPGQLLLELGAGLRSYSAEAESAFKEVERRVLELHERLSDQPEPDDLLDNVRASSRVINSFVSLLATFSSPVLLILDTCEELAKAYPGGDKVPGIEATFWILEQIRQRIDVRVVFAGRRPLALAGHGWRLPADSVGAGEARLPDHKAYLRLQRIRGFDDDETAVFLRERLNLDISEEMLTAIRLRSRENIVSTEVEYDPQRAADTTQRYNPFDLALYGEWLHEVPDLDPDKVAHGSTDPYIEMRIVQRPTREVRTLLPGAVALGRFDEEMLRPVYPGNAAEFGAAFQMLGEQEWINLQHDKALNTTFLEIDRGLLPRLRRYYNDAKLRQQVEQARSKLAPALTTLIEKRPIEKLGTEHLHAALRLLDPQPAGELWESVTRRVGAGDWNGIYETTAKLLGDVVDERHPLRSLIKASQAAAQIHLNPRYDCDRLWADVELHCGNDPDPQRVAWLTVRARAGQFASSWIGKRPPSHQQIALLDADLTDYLWHAATSGADDPRTRELTASLFAAASVAMDWQRSGHEPAAGLVTLKEFCKVASSGSDVLAICATSLRGIVAESLEDSTGRVHLLEAIEQYDTLDSRPATWLDWLPPPGLADHLRHAFLQVASPNDDSVIRQRGAWLESALTRLEHVDSERLASRILQQWLAVEPVPHDILDRCMAHELSKFAQLPRNYTQMSTSPLVVSVARSWLSAGMATKAIELTESLEQHGTVLADRGLIVDEAMRAKLDIVRRMRGGRNPIWRSFMDHPNPEYSTAGWQTAALVGPPLIDDPPHLIENMDLHAYTEQLHRWWRSRNGLRSRGSKLAGQFFQRMELFPLAQIPPRALSRLYLDAQEATLLADGPMRDKLASACEQMEKLQPRMLTSDGEAGVRHVLRWWMIAETATARRSERRLAGELEGSLKRHGQRRLAEITMTARRSERRLAGELEEAVKRHGQRRLAEIALEEAEITALRLPGQAAVVLDLAAHWFRESGDTGGAVIAGIRQMIARLHAGLTYDVFEVEEEFFMANLRADYSKLAEGKPGLPAWDTLGDVSATEGPGEGWSGWRWRLQSVIRQLRGEPLLEDTRGWSSTARGETPSELEFETASVAEPPKVKLASARRPWTEVIGNILGVVIGITVGAGVLWMGFKLAAYGARAVFPNINLVGEIVAFVLSLALLGWTGNAWTWTRSLWRSFTRIRLKISPVSPRSSGQAVELTDAVSTLLEQSVAYPKFNLQRPSSWPVTEHRYTLQTEGQNNVEIDAAGLSEPGWDRIAELTKGLAHHQAVVVLDVDPSLTRLPWEAWFSYMTDRANGKATRLSFVRSQYAPLPLLSGRRSKPQQLVIVAPVTWHMTVEEIWSPMRLQPHFVLDPMELHGDSKTGPSPGSSSGPGKKPHSIWHLIGSPVRTRAGLMLDFSSGESTGKADSRSEQLISAELLAKAMRLRGHMPGLIVVQGAPAPGPRTSIDREQTADLRQFASTLIAGGAAPAALVLPGLGLDYCVGSLRPLADVLRRLPVNRRRLPGAIGQMRELIRGAKADRTTTREELSNDITLFTVPEGDMDNPDELKQE